jgi:DNA-binding NarL/FixJ family response regulator
MAASLRSFDSVLVSGTARDRATAVSVICSLAPHVALIDMAVTESLDLLRELRAEAPKTGLVAFAIDESVSSIVECARAGASAYITVDATLAEVVLAVERAAAGELLCSPRVSAELFRRLGEFRSPHEGASLSFETLTARERDVLLCLTGGRSNKQIASALNISEATVKNHVHHILTKLRVESRAQAALLASRPEARLRRSTPSISRDNL